MGASYIASSYTGALPGIYNLDGSITAQLQYKELKMMSKLKINTIRTHDIKLGGESEPTYIFLVIKFGARDSSMLNPESSRNMPLKMHIFSCTRKTVYCSSWRERAKHYL